MISGSSSGISLGASGASPEVLALYQLRSEKNAAGGYVGLDANSVVIGTIAIRSTTSAIGAGTVFTANELVIYSDTQQVRIGNGFTSGGLSFTRFILNDPIVVYNELTAADSGNTKIALTNIQSGSIYYPNSVSGTGPGFEWDSTTAAIVFTGINNDGTQSTDPTRVDIRGVFRSYGNGHIFERVTTNTTLSDFPKSLIVDTSAGGVTINLDPEGTLGLVNELWPEGTTITILKDGINNNANSVTIDSIGTTWGAALFYSNATPAGAATYSFTGRWAGVRVTRLPAAVVSVGWLVEPF